MHKIQKQLHLSASPKNIKDLRSRQALTDLLEGQIDRNEDLEKQNKKLESQQRKLVQLLEMRTNEVVRMRQERRLQESRVSLMQQNSVVYAEQQKGYNDQSTALHNMTQQQQSNNLLQGTMETLKSNILQKEEEMMKMRDFYTRAISKLEGQLEIQKKSNISQEIIEKHYEQELHFSQELIKKQKKRIEQLMDSLQKAEEQAGQELKGRQLVEEKLAKAKKQLSVQDKTENKINEQNQIVIAHLHNEIKKLKQKHESQLIAIQEHHQEQQQQLRRTCQEKIRQNHSEALRKIEILTNSHKVTERQWEEKVQEKEQELLELRRQSEGLEEKYRNILIKYEKQCQIVISIEQKSNELEKQNKNLQEKLRNIVENKELEGKSAKQIEIEYESKIKNYEDEIEELGNQIQRLNMQVTESQGKSKRAEQSIKKYQTSNASLQDEMSNLKLELTTKTEQMEDLSRQYRLKDDEIKRLNLKIQKENQRKENYTKKLQQKINNLENSLAENQSKLFQKQNSVEQYKEEAKSFVNKLKEELAKVVESRDTLQKQNKVIRNEVKQIESKFSAMMMSMQNKQQETNKKYEGASERLRNVEEERNNYKSLYQDTLNEIKRLKQKNQKYLVENNSLKQTISNMQIQVEELKNDILENNLVESEKELLERLKQEAFELKAKMEKAATNLNKVKDENVQLINSILGLQNSNQSLASQNTMLTHEIQMKKQKIQQLEDKKCSLQNALKERSQQLETSMPYLNRVIEQKKNIELQYEKKMHEIKKLTSLLEIAKKSKAEEIIELKNKNHTDHKYIEELRSEVNQNRSVIQRFNRQKVSMLRENTMREDKMKKMESQILNLKQQLQESQKNCEQMMRYIEIAEIAEENTGVETFGAKNRRR